MQELPNPNERTQPTTPPEGVGVGSAPKASRSGVPKWVWIALGVGVLGMCMLCGGALVMLGIIGAMANNSEPNPYTVSAPAPEGGIPGGAFAPPASGGATPYGYSSPGFGADFMPDSGGSSSLPDLSTGSDDFMDSLRQSDAERSWWSEEWSRALGDNYPEPTHVDPEGNPGWVDSSGAFHDYNSGMSDYEASTLSNE
ncbi:hypothetical protein GXSOP10_1381 [Armatimonadetes bacterium GXS]|nr:hypothetical protein GXSOP10_1381 [Armatimonadetes bacterium GXS]